MTSHLGGKKKSFKLKTELWRRFFFEFMSKTVLKIPKILSKNKKRWMCSNNEKTEMKFRQNFR